MFPGIDPKMMKQAMKKMGIKEENLDASKVIITLSDRELVFDSPQVSKINMMGQETYQIIGEPVERELSESDENTNNTETAEAEDTTPEINDDDIKTVMELADCSEETARSTLEETKGDIAEAIVKIKRE
ncbi:nascent polypeptide-associated complex protein [Candidatus Woesearchaeota archaeon]|nr:nascent polypeptide-associated complex protein [Candidatus Woesearchaeota archaeon]